jgi:DEAD/DEAH box helicase domain-containing protein
MILTADGIFGGLGLHPQEEADRHPRIARARHAYLHEQAFRIGLWADEHSAQLAPEENRRLQDLFGQGIRNILSATTTMEVGIDIGGLCGVLMANMPPGLANYLQRGGRAGRRTDGASIVCTFARRQPYDQAAFDDFASFFRRELRRANVMLEREGIARRHLQAMLLGEFFQAIRPLAARAGAMDAFGKIGAFCGVDRLPYVESGAVGVVSMQPPIPVPLGTRRVEAWWDTAREPNLSAEFGLFLRHLEQDGGVIRERALSLAVGTGFAGRVGDWEGFIQGVAERFTASAGEWLADYRRVVEQWQAESESGASAAKFRMNASPTRGGNCAKPPSWRNLATASSCRATAFLSVSTLSW